MVSQLNEAQARKSPALAPGSGRGVERFVRAAAEKLALKDYTGAVSAADQALEQDPASTAALYYRAAAHNLSGDYEAAAFDATRALTLNPRDPGARDTRAWALNHLGRFRDAIADSRHSLELNVQNPYALANLGYSYEQMGDLSAMLRHLKAA